VILAKPNSDNSVHVLNPRLNPTNRRFTISRQLTLAESKEEMSNLRQSRYSFTNQVMSKVNFTSI
jgi:hypothetical protein